MTEDIKIRDLKPEDWENWRTLWTAYFTFYEMSRPEAVYDSTFARLLGNKPQDFKCLVAEGDQGLLGLTHYAFYPHAHYVEQVCYLQDLYVDKTIRGRGIGRALIEAVSDRAQAHGCPYVYWLTAEDNTAARHLYDQMAKLEDFVRYVRTLPVSKD